jgi:mRNA-degrading endonuclease RelE of RelBE toxin-antitoxin system
LKYEFKPSFDKTFKKLDPVRKKRVLEAISLLIDFFETGEKTKGLGLKHLREKFCEIRIDINNRIIFTLEEDTVGFVIVGSRDEIRKFLKSIQPGFYYMNKRKNIKSYVS